jgi:uncharacterized protein HemX
MIAPPEQRVYLYQNLALKLESARFALLSGDNTLYHQTIETIAVWLKQYFDQQASNVRAIQSTLDELNTINLAPDLPNLGASLDALQTVMSQRQQAGQQVPDPQPSEVISTKDSAASVKHDPDTAAHQDENPGVAGNIETVPTVNGAKQ